MEIPEVVTTEDLSRLTNESTTQILATTDEVLAMLGEHEEADHRVEDELKICRQQVVTDLETFNAAVAKGEVVDIGSTVIQLFVTVSRLTKMIEIVTYYMSGVAVLIFDTKDGHIDL